MELNPVLIHHVYILYLCVLIEYTYWLFLVFENMPVKSQNVSKHSGCRHCFPFSGWFPWCTKVSSSSGINYYRLFDS